LAHPCRRRFQRWATRNPDGSICRTPRINKRPNRRPPAPKRNESCST
jgi:hypothetical protein